MTETAFVWKGERLETIRDIGRALVALESPEDAREFMVAYSKHSVHAYQNVGYISGYYDRKTMIRIQEWCETSHPIFGRRVPSNDEALEAGIRVGSKLRQTGCII